MHSKKIAVQKTNKQQQQKCGDKKKTKFDVCKEGGGGGGGVNYRYRASMELNVARQEKQWEFAKKPSLPKAGGI